MNFMLIPNSPTRLKQNAIGMFSTALAVALLTGCAGRDSSPEGSGNGPSLVLTRVAQNDSRQKAADSTFESIIDLDIVWQTWDGAVQPNVRFENDRIVITGEPENENAVVLGAHRYTTPLITGAEYVLDVGEFSTAGSAALIFAYSLGGYPVSLSNDDYAMATPGNPFRFTAPPEADYFWIQLQNEYGNPGADAVLSPELGTVSTPPVQTSGELIDYRIPVQPWHLREWWFTVNSFDCAEPLPADKADCVTPGISSDGSSFIVQAGPVSADENGALIRRQYAGIQYYRDQPLAGRYVFEVDGPVQNTAAMIYGLGAAGNPNHGNAHFVTNWTRPDGKGRVVFTANNTRGFVLLVQNPWVAYPMPYPAGQFKVSLRPCFDFVCP